MNAIDRAFARVGADGDESEKKDTTARTLLKSLDENLKNLVYKAFEEVIRNTRMALTVRLFEFETRSDNDADAIYDHYLFEVHQAALALQRTMTDMAFRNELRQGPIILRTLKSAPSYMSDAMNVLDKLNKALPRPNEWKSDGTARLVRWVRSFLVNAAALSTDPQTWSPEIVKIRAARHDIVDL